MPGYDFESLEQLRLNYVGKLGELFHQQSVKDLAKLSQDPKYQAFIHDYINLQNISLEFRKEFEVHKSTLEQKAKQTTQETTRSISIIEARQKEVRHWQWLG